MTIFQFLEQQGIQITWQTEETLSGIHVSVAEPSGWVKAAPEEAGDTGGAFQIFGKKDVPEGEYIPRAILMVGQLSGPVDPQQVVSYGFVDAERLPEWHRIRASLDDYSGFPSSFIEGTYRNEGNEFHVYNRYIIAAGAGKDFLVQWTVRATESQIDGIADDIDQLENKLSITAD
ncbi:hypothetical protein AWC31_25850 [Mycolicibacterium wolinskyi]|uniref:Lipoprotein LpqN n=2 Tax=Mycobacteriaceae TaxID=1762 RepID=A0A1X2F840_9MYCO|nr:hypothetical protein AWC31_25850 [Mycolicibacterium wolinskyi]